MEALGIGAASFASVAEGGCEQRYSGKPDGFAGTPKRNKKSAVLKKLHFLFLNDFIGYYSQTKVYSDTMWSQSSSLCLTMALLT